MRLHLALTRVRRGLLLVALLCVLLARTAVPAGWMPMATADGGIMLAPCSGMGATTLAADDMAGMSGHHADADHNRHHPDPGGDHPCSGAGIAVALDAPRVLLAPVLPAVTTAIVARAFVVTIGQGLAAPPPPQTGPPIRV